MSQADKINYLPVLLWFVFFFVLFYFCLFTFFLPLVFRALKVRSFFFFEILTNCFLIDDFFFYFRFIFIEGVSLVFINLLAGVVIFYNMGLSFFFKSTLLSSLKIE